MGAEYGLRRVERPPVPRRGGTGPRKSALMGEIEKVMAEPNTWFAVAVYQSRTGAYSAAARMRKREWAMPMVFWPVSEDAGSSELFVKAIAVTQGGEDEE